eukprot:jgi/Hompol1/527/HPOL_005347-RA
MAATDRIQADEWLLLKLSSGNSKLFILKSDDSVVDLGKFGKFCAKDLVGKHQLVPYEIFGNNELRRLENLNYLQEFDMGETEEDANNKDLVDDPASQKLSHEEIEKLKTKSLSGEIGHETIIKAILENNVTFEKKTEFSKAKYIKRKQRKFAKIFIPIKPTARALCDFYFSKSPEKIRELRMDTLSQMLTQANVRAGSRFLVVDDAAGILVGAMLERMHGHGKIFLLHDKQSPVINLVDTMNFSPEITKIVSSLPWFHLDALPPKTDPSNPTALERANERYQQLVETFETIHRGDFDGLLVASRFDPNEILKKLSPLLAPSKPIVFYSPEKEMLLETFSYARVSRRYINTQLTESWLREYQVPSASSGMHPSMMTSGSGGYLFTATTVVESGPKIARAGASLPGTGGLDMGQKKSKKQKVDPEVPVSTESISALETAEASTGLDEEGMQEDGEA